MRPGARSASFPSRPLPSATSIGSLRASERVARRLKTRWDRSASAGETLDVVEELKRFTVDVTMLIVFGHDVNTVEQGGDVIQSELDVILPAINRRLFAAHSDLALHSHAV